MNALAARNKTASIYVSVHKWSQMATDLAREGQ